MIPYHSVMLKNGIVLAVVLMLCSCAQPLHLELTESHVLPGFGFSIQYPTEWSTAEIEENVLAVAENVWESERLSYRFDETGFTRVAGGQAHGLVYEGSEGARAVAPLQTKVSSYQVVFTLNETQFVTAKVNSRLNRSDVTHEPPREFFKTSVGLYGYQIPKESKISEIEIFGVPAVRAMLRNTYSATILILGHKDEFTFSLRILARTNRRLRAFMPTWEKMLASVKPVEE